MVGSIFSGSASTDLGAGSMSNGNQLVDQLQTALAERRKKKQLELPNFKAGLTSMFGDARRDLYGASGVNG
jgi:hypothetical protein